jgi:hypothetical protein
MTMVVLGLPLSGPTDLPYQDVMDSDWFAPYVRTAVASRILPIPGQDGERFSSSKLLMRGEAAAYIWKTLQTKGVVSSRTSSSSVPSVAPPVIPPLVTPSPPRMQAVDVPFSDTVSAGNTAPYYTFTSTRTQTIDVIVTRTDAANKEVQCFLYHTIPDGIASEYYVGIQEGGQCFLRVTVVPGSWQLQVETPGIKAPFTVTARSSTVSDGNDGFSQAVSIPVGDVRVSNLPPGDIEDWYTFSLTREQDMTVDVLSTLTLGCLIYPMDDVDIFGFEEPVCGKPYHYPTGTYMVAVRHLPPRGMHAAYSVRTILQK